MNDTRVKWYEIGLQLGVSVGTLDAIKKDNHTTSDCLIKTITIWLKTCPSLPTWSNIVNALRSCTVGEVRLAEDLETKYCSTQDTSVAATSVGATHHRAPPSLSQLDTPTTTPQQSQSQAHVPPAPPVPSSKAHIQTTPPRQSTIFPTKPPVLAYSVIPPSQPSPWSVHYYCSPHTSYPSSTPFPLTSHPSTDSVVHLSYSQLSQVTPTSSGPLLPSVPTQLTIPQLPTTFPQYPSPSSLTTIPPDTSPILPPATVTTPPDYFRPVTTHTLG